MSTPSHPTPAHPSDDPTSASTPTMPKRPTLTLILAATPSLGIGKNNTLPWPQLRKEMGYFARVTKRVSPGSKRINAVLMGRKTWDSIPAQFRPLKDRLNIVITRDVVGFEKRLNLDGTGKGVEGPVVAEGVVDALSQLESRAHEVEKVFVIGGASVYAAALEMPQTKSVLLTQIKEEFGCDTFFPVDLEGASGWRRAGRERLEEFVGEEVKGGVEEKGVRFEFCLFERE